MIVDCRVQQYAWGKKGGESEVARVKKSSDASFEVDKEKPYAELWMGTHPSAPSKLPETGQMLSEYLADKANLIGTVPSGYPANDLPFLFKVLSINTALSIQAHPDKALAQELHARNPENYKDANHKPEMAIALTQFEALCGFRPIFQIRHFLDIYPEFRSLVGQEAYDEISAVDDQSPEEAKSKAVRGVFLSFTNCEDSIVSEQLAVLIERLKANEAAEEAVNGGPGSPNKKKTRGSPRSHETTRIQSLMLGLNKGFPGDRGVMIPLLLNYITLSPGEGFFMGPNEPHAYISGDCVECMALSDNVVRAGLTPKFRDVETLCKMLHYKVGVPALIQPKGIDEHTMCYRPSPTICTEFEVEVTNLPAHAMSSSEGYTLRPLPCASLLLVLRGSHCMMKTGSDATAKPVPEGSVIFQAAGESITLLKEQRPNGNGNGNGLGDVVIVYRAHINMGSSV
jgi:mannose-6-phosphate isomerase